MIRWALLTLSAVAASGCGPAASNDSDAGDTSCLDRMDLDAYSAGMTRTSSSGNVKFTIVQGNPSPPARYTNTWTMTMTDANGAAIPNAAPTAVPFMPEHGHGSSVNPEMTSNGGTTYQVTPLYFFMPGIWQTTLSPTPTSLPADQVKFTFCISG